MSIKRLSPEESLALNKFAVDEGHPHIIVDKAICATLHRSRMFSRMSRAPLPAERRPGQL